MAKELRVVGRYRLTEDVNGKSWVNRTLGKRKGSRIMVPYATAQLLLAENDNEFVKICRRCLFRNNCHAPQVLRRLANDTGDAGVKE